MLGYHPTCSSSAEWKMPDWPKRDESTQCNDRIYRYESLKQELDAWVAKKNAAQLKGCKKSRQ